MKVGSLFAGIGGFDLAAELAGHEVAWQVEINKQCRSILARHFDAPIYPDVTEFGSRYLGGATRLVRPDIICGGFPCQDVSVAGDRAGLAGERSGLWWEFHRLLAEFLPRWVCIENVPGLLSSNDGRDMGAILWSLGQLGYGWSYRVLDSQYFGVPQRRRRVFIVGCIGSSRRAAEVLFEPESVCRDLAPQRKTGEGIAAAFTRGADSNGKGGAAGRRQEDDVNIVPTLDCGSLQLHAARHGHAMTTQQAVESGQIVPMSVAENQRAEIVESEVCSQLSTGGGKPGQGYPAIFEPRIGRNGRGQPSELVGALKGSEAGETSDMRPCVFGQGVRRLTPTECERLQAFPDGWTAKGKDGEPMSDSARYRMLGNAVTVNVVEWIMMRLKEAEGAGPE